MEMGAWLQQKWVLGCNGNGCLAVMEHEAGIEQILGLDLDLGVGLDLGIDTPAPSLIVVLLPVMLAASMA